MSDTATPALEPQSADAATRPVDRAAPAAEPAGRGAAGAGAPERPSAAELLEAFGERDHSVQSLFRFAFVPAGRLRFLRELAAPEDWGEKEIVLLRYLALHLPLAIEQGRLAWNDEQLVLAAGELRTAGGAPIYVGLVRNANPRENPWVLNWVGERPSTAELPAPADLGTWPALDPGGEVVVALDLADGERRARLAGLDDAPPLARASALAGALSWSLHRGLAVPQLHGGVRGHFVPVYLTQRDDLTRAPDRVVPVVVADRRIVARALLAPQVAYAPARALVERWEQLPAWVIEAWDEAMERQGTAAGGSPADNETPAADVAPDPEPEGADHAS